MKTEDELLNLIQKALIERVIWYLKEGAHLEVKEEEAKTILKKIGMKLLVESGEFK